MSQSPSEMTGLRMVFEGAPDSLLTAIDQIETRMDTSEKKAVKSANRIEEAIKRSLQVRSQASADAAQLQERYADSIRSQMDDLGDEYVQVEQKAVQSSHAQVDALGQLGEAMDRRTEGMRRMAGAASAAVGIFTGMVGVVTTLVGLFAVLGVRMLESARKAGEANEQYSDLWNTIERMTDQKTGSAFERISEDTERMHDAIADSNVDIERQIELWDKLYDQEGKRNKQAYQERDQERRRDREDRKNALGDELRDLSRSLHDSLSITPEQEALREYERTLQQISDMQERRRRNGGYDSVAADEARRAAKAVYDERMALIEAEKEARRQAEQDREFADIRRHQREIQRINELEQKRIESDARVIEAAAEKFNQSFGNNESTRLLQTIVKKIDQNGRRNALAQRVI